MDAEARIRECLARGVAALPDDVAELLGELSRVRLESQQRWEAIGKLAPAAKHHRARSQGLTRLASALRDHLDVLEQTLDASTGSAAAELRGWLVRARELVEAALGEP